MNKSYLGKYKILYISGNENFTHKSDEWQQTNEVVVYYITEYLKINRDRLLKKSQLYRRFKKY